VNPIKCPVCCADAYGTPYFNRDVQFIQCPGCGDFDAPKTTVLLILRDLLPLQRALLSFCLRHEARGETPLVLDDERTKNILRERKLPPPDEQEENLIRAVGKTLDSGETELPVDLRYFASEIGAPSEKALRELVANLLDKGVVVSEVRNTPMVRHGQVNQMRLGLTPDGARKYKELRANLDTSHGRSAKVFLSHAASDEHIALVLKAEIERRLPDVGVFCSSDPTDLPPGTKWSLGIQQALQESAMLILVASGRGLQRPWVWFECGTFWFSKRMIMPICLGDVRKNALPPPLSELQAINGDEPNGLNSALDQIAAATGATVSDASHLDKLSERLKALDHEADATSKASSAWRGAEWKGRFLAYDGPCEGLKLNEDAFFNPSMQHALEAAGYRVALYAQNNFNIINESVRLVYLTDRKSWRSRIAQGGAWLVAEPARPPSTSRRGKGPSGR